MEPTPPVVLTAEERLTLEQWARRPTTAQGLAQRARLVLACALSQTNGEIAAAAGITRQTVGRWRHRFVRKRLPGLLDEPRPGAPRKITDAEVERVIALTLEGTPRDATHWSNPVGHLLGERGFARALRRSAPGPEASPGRWPAPARARWRSCPARARGSGPPPGG
jgi:transposase